MKIQKYKDIINEEVGMRNIKSILAPYKEAEIVFHMDYDGLMSFYAMREYLRKYNIKVVDAHITQYGDKQFQVPQNLHNRLYVLVDFASNSSSAHFSIMSDHHDRQTGADSVNSTYFKTARSNAEIISGEISPYDILTHEDMESVKTIDSADFFARGITPENIQRSIFSKDPNKSGKENRYLLGFVVNRLVLAYKNKLITVKSFDGKREYKSKNLLECLALDASPSIHSMFNVLQYYIKNAETKIWDRKTRSYLIAGLTDPEDLQKNQNDYLDRMKDYKDLHIIDGCIGVQIGGGSMFDAGSYDRYTVFKNYPDIDFFCIMWPMGLIQISCNPFKEKILDINLGAMAKEVLIEKFKSKFEQIYIPIWAFKSINEEKLLKDPEGDKKLGYKWDDLINVFGKKLCQKVGRDKYINFDPNSNDISEYKLLMNKNLKDITSDERKILSQHIFVNFNDLISDMSGGHKSITNISFGAYLAYSKDKMKELFDVDKYTEVMKIVLRDMVRKLRVLVKDAQELKKAEGVIESKKIKLFKDFI